MKNLRISFIGFGEVASAFSAALLDKGAAVSAYDVLIDQEKGMETLRKRSQKAGIVFCDLPKAVASADYVLSTVTTHVAESAARACAEFLKQGQVFVDLNATSPSVKRVIAEVIRPTGADFVEGAILGAIGVTGSRTQILTGGPKASETAGTLNQLGLNIAAYSAEIGKASTFKMLRSVFSKGLEALLIEFLVAGRRAGIQEDLWREIVDLFSKNAFARVAENWITSHATAHERRYHEMEQVVAVLQEMGLEPILTSGTVEVFRRSCELGLKEAFPEKPKTADEVITFMEQQLKRK
jgi:3-hydroxyisobutyrate dehydrogenase-like beta-hydroxyacid dehydrogenase